ncbi:ATP-binding protein [uncultured Ramlibacter sp.]|uniref:ATP-binding protein n=1 Tax=uncultured Ramlibacter sp. TaxID=260755 RepID=UPI0026075AEE|nr:ATP-binding protein [uncultured Ramlibacter sp.]
MQSTRRFLLTALSVSLAALLVMTVALYEVAVHSRTSSSLVENTHEILLAIAEAEQEMEQFETALEAQLRQPDADRALRRMEMQERVRAHLLEAADLLAADQAQPADSLTLMRTAVHTVDALAAIDPGGRQVLVQAQQLSSDVRSALSGLEEAQLKLLGSRRSQHRDSSNMVLLALLAMGVVSAVAIALVFRSYNRQALQLAQSERRIGRLVQGLPLSVWQLRQIPGRMPEFEFVSDNAEQQLGLTPDGQRLTTARIAANILPEDRPAFDRAWALARDTLAPWQVDARVAGLDHTRWIRSRATARREANGDVLWSGYWADVTAEVEMDRALTLAIEKAKLANAAKSNFLASVSHEIRTPMNGMLGMLELFDLSALGEDQRAMLKVIRSSARSLLLIVNDLLDFSKIEAGKLTLNPVADSVQEVVNTTAEIHRTAASGKGLALSVTVAPTLAPRLLFDPLRLAQIMNNLVSNAVKFTAAGKVGIEVAAIDGPDGTQKLRIAVSDSGEGMSPEVLARLFRPYEQASSETAARFGGTGLGLVICKRLTQQMGGELEIRSEPDRGTEVTLCVAFPVAPDDGPLPLRGELQAPADGLLPMADAPAGSGRGPRLLIVDDHPTNRQLIKRQVELLGYSADTACDGEDALAQWLAGSYAAVLADCNMPRMDGYALAAFIREAEQERGLPRIPIVACTANALPSATAKCLAAGMDDYLVKPMQLGQIARCLARWVPGEEAPSLPVLSHGVLDAVCGGDAQARAEILAHFNRLHAEDCATLFEAVRRDDMTSAKAQAHRIRGSCLMIGAVSLADVCERIELLAEGRDAQGVGAAMGALAQENARLQHALATSADTAEATR